MALPVVCAVLKLELASLLGPADPRETKASQGPCVGEGGVGGVQGTRTRSPAGIFRKGWN